jgi:hypothetical protein
MSGASTGWLSRFGSTPQRWLIQLSWGRPRFRHGDDNHEQGDHGDGGESEEGRVVAKRHDDARRRLEREPDLREAYVANSRDEG